MEAWIGWVLGGGGLAALFSAWLVYKASKRRNTDLALAERFDDASELARYINERVEAEVERKVAPFRAELEKVKGESHEMNDAVRARETQLWLWDQRGRMGLLPMLPTPILERLGLGHLLPTDEGG
ncbi:hypothetical protein L332_03680 [Agrococcus pavilionensis RW1]|uniref:Uncharacterized protein n=1 Tax=Agrococcus pavilionensis RW1 TaxID=1330458 RepID=U1LNK4_9MICO|nr:hypothetical protein [Agrococcus pavilionensis]ERG63552.1 hypothetical protein L332_03680 [Agrococcus pavilionensis RW1]